MYLVVDWSHQTCPTYSFFQGLFTLICVVSEWLLYIAGSISVLYVISRSALAGNIPFAGS